jgi:acetate kinase
VWLIGTTGRSNPHGLTPNESIHSVYRERDLRRTNAYSDSIPIAKTFRRHINLNQATHDGPAILTVNTGSSSVRLATYRRNPTSFSRIASLHSNDIASPASMLTEILRRGKSPAPHAIAHRVVHGGDRFVEACVIDNSVEAEITRLAPLAPLHNPVALRWIQACRDAFGRDVLQVAVFDTAFFSDLPRFARTYPLPKALNDTHRLRRYGFHGLAHQSMWQRWCALRPDLDQGGRIITLQLGSGCSMTAIDRGKPQDTSMGFSPLEGLMMATRSGDLDPGLITYLQQREQLSTGAIETILNRQSGLLGVSGEADMQRLLLRDDEDARLALAMYCHRVRKYLGAYLAVLGGADAVLLGGGVAENTPVVRESILANMEWTGLALDAQSNRAAIAIEACITHSDSRMQAWVVPVDEGALLAAAADSLMRQQGDLR